MSLIRKIEYLDIDTLKGDMKTIVSYILEKTPIQMEFTLIDRFTLEVDIRNDLILTVRVFENGRLHRWYICDRDIMDIDETNVYQTVDDFKRFFDDYSENLDNMYNLLQRHGLYGGI